ncbi:MAG TPA: MBL fold metallo-hydrolase [Flavobacteriales bacterium]|nr:MBL fold metallo-hydrolase [Flavobacteriales bacterium]
MKIHFLGTGTSQGVPVIGCHCPVCQSTNEKDKRLRTSVMLEWNDVRYVIDCGPDFRTQMLQENVETIDGILFTHEHADHIAGLDDIRPLYFRAKKPMPIYGLPRVINDLKRRFEYIFTTENRYPGAPEVAVHLLEPHQKIVLGGKTVEALPVLHGQLPILGYKIENLAYITDAKTLPDSTIEALKNLDLLVINALHHRPHKTHLNLEEALALISRLQPKQAILTHMSHHMGLHEDIDKTLPKHVSLAYDGLCVEL